MNVGNHFKREIMAVNNTQCHIFFNQPQFLGNTVTNQFDAFATLTQKQQQFCVHIYS